MSYLIQCGNGYVARAKNNVPYITTNKDMAIHCESEQKAVNIMTTLPKLMRDKGIQIMAEKDNLETEVETEVEESTFINSKYTPVDMDNIKSLICDLSNQFQVMKGNKDWLLEMESKVDQEISDILHYIEFYQFNACDGYKLAKELKALRLKRRDIKNQIQAIDIIGRHTCNMLADGKTNKALCDIENKTYTPRVLKEMFEEKQN